MSNRSREGLLVTLATLSLALPTTGCSSPTSTTASASSTAGAGSTASGKASASSASPRTSSGAAAASAAPSASAAAASEPKKPRVLASGQKNISDFTLSGDAIYWVDRDGGAVMSVPLAGGEPKTLAKIKEPVSVAVSGGDVLFGTWGDNPTTHAQVLSVPLAGGEPKELASPMYPVTQIVVAPTRTYFASGTTVGQIADGKTSTVADVAPNAAVIALGESGVYVGGFPISMEVTSPTGTLDLWSFDGKKTSIATKQAGPHAILSSGDLYWLNQGVESDHGGAAIMTLPSGASGPKELVKLGSSSGPRQLASDKERVYWSNGEVIFSAPRSGGAPEPLVKGLLNVRGVAVTSAAYVWATADSVVTLAR